MKPRMAYSKGCRMVESTLKRLGDTKGVYLVMAYGQHKDDFSEKLIVFEKAVGTPDPKCQEVAMNKAQIAWETGVSGEVVARHNPLYLLSKDNTCLWEGSAIRNIGKISVVVSVSGSTGLRDKFLAEVFLLTVELFLAEKAKKSLDGGFGYLTVSHD